MDHGQAADLRKRVVDSIGTLLPGMINRDVPAMPEDTRLFEELGLSSSKTLELLLALEEDLDLHVDIAEIDGASLETVGSLADFVAAHSTEIE
jgi:acyl carrier protein